MPKNIMIDDFFRFTNSEIKTPSPIQPLDLEIFRKSGLKVEIKRDDLIHPWLSGNKWRKLKFNLIDAKEKGHKKILSYGGAYSNHLFSVASAGYMFGFETIGILRGEIPNELNPILKHCVNMNMKIVPVSRSQYSEKNSPEFQKKIETDFGNTYQIPEGGYSILALKGIEEMTKEIYKYYDYVIVAMGTATTFAGLINFLPNKTKVIGIPVLKNGIFLEKEALFLLNLYNNELKLPISKSICEYFIKTSYHFGGYGKKNTYLENFISHFNTEAGIKIEPVYTGKMMYGLFDLVEKGFFKMGDSILIIHTGGIYEF